MKTLLALLLTLGALPLQAMSLKGEIVPIGGYAVGNFIDIDQNYGNVGFIYFCPLKNEQTFAFQDTQFFFLDNRDWCASVGLGIRHHVSQLKGFLGANLYYDYRNVHHHRQTLNRMGVGVEYLANCVEVRANGYFPFGTQFSKSDRSVPIVYPGGFSTSVSRSRISVWGVDAELGVWLWKKNAFGFYVAGGPYVYGNYKKTFRKDPFAGGYGRALFSYNSYCNVELRTSYDQVFKGRVEGVFWLQFPIEYFCNSFRLKNRACSPCENIWSRPVFRHNILATVDCCCFNGWNWDSPAF